MRSEGTSVDGKPPTCRQRRELPVQVDDVTQSRVISAAPGSRSTSVRLPGGGARSTATKPSTERTKGCADSSFSTSSGSPQETDSGWPQRACGVRHLPVSPAPRCAPPIPGVLSPGLLLSPPLLSLCCHRRSLNEGAHKALPPIQPAPHPALQGNDDVAERPTAAPTAAPSPGQLAGPPLSSLASDLPPSGPRLRPALVLALLPPALSFAHATPRARLRVLPSAPGPRGGSCGLIPEAPSVPGPLRTVLYRPVPPRTVPPCPQPPARACPPRLSAGREAVLTSAFLQAPSAAWVYS